MDFPNGVCHKPFMTETKTIKNPSPLVLAALALDEHFTNLKRLAGRIDEIDMNSDFDVKQSEKLILHFSENGQAVSGDIHRFVTALNEARHDAELAAQKVAIKADELKLRKENVQEKMIQFEALVKKVTRINEALIQFKPQGGTVLTDQERLELKSYLSEISGQLNGLIEEAEAF